MTIFNEETFSLKSGLQKGPRREEIEEILTVKGLIEN